MLSNFLYVNNLKIHYLKNGEGEKCFLFIHGLIGNSFWYEKILTLFPYFIKGIAVDLPGYGFSESVKYVNSLRDLAFYLYKIIEYEKCQELIPIAHSISGFLGLTFIKEFVTDKVSKAVFVSFHSLERKVKEEDIENLKRNLDDKNAFFSSILKTTGLPENDPLLNKIIEVSQKTDKNSILNYLKLHKRINYTSYISSLADLQTFFIYGENDELIDITQLKKTASFFRKSIVIGIKNSSHTPFLDSTKRFFSLLSDLFYGN